MAGKTLSETGPRTVVAEVVYSGDKLILPDGMDLDEAIDLIQRRKEYLTERVEMSDTFDVFPWDGAHAIDVVLTKKFGWSPATATPGFFGPQPPKMITIDVGPNTTKQVPWGAFSLPGVKGKLETDVSVKNGRYVFALSAVVQRKDEATIRQIFDMVREELKVNSIYRGQAIKIRFTDDNGNKLRMPEPKFMDTSKISEDMVIYPDAVQEQIRTNLFTPIERVADCLANDIAVKRGVLLGGTYGTGKTLAATVASKIAVDNGITYLYVPRADELSEAIEFAKQYQSPACVIFCEDIDRALAGERSVKMDDILNIIDGIDTKNSNLITVLTTNDLQAINPAMLRPGRLDAVIEVLPPDAKAVEKLIRLYGAEAIDKKTDLTDVGKALSGNIPAVIAEVVKRSKLAQLGLQARGERVTKISAEALMNASKSMQQQLTLLRERTEAMNAKVEPTVDSVLGTIIERHLGGAGKVDTLHTTVREIRERV